MRDRGKEKAQEEMGVSEWPSRREGEARQGHHEAERNLPGAERTPAEAGAVDEQKQSE